MKKIFFLWAVIALSSFFDSCATAQKNKQKFENLSAIMLSGKKKGKEVRIKKIPFGVYNEGDSIPIYYLHKPKGTKPRWAIVKN